MAKKLPQYVWDKRDLQPGLDGVMVVGLRNNPELNGSIGLLEGRAPGGLILVRVSPITNMTYDEQLLSLKPKHVRTTVPIQEAGALLGPESSQQQVLRIPLGFGKFCRRDAQASIVTATSCYAMRSRDNRGVQLHVMLAHGSCAKGLPCLGSL